MQIWGLRVVDMRLLFTIDMRDRLFGKTAHTHTEIDTCR
jgi:hypothetical protein